MCQFDTNLDTDEPVGDLYVPSAVKGAKRGARSREEALSIVAAYEALYDATIDERMKAPDRRRTIMAEYLGISDERAFLYNEVSRLRHAARRRSLLLQIDEFLAKDARETRRGWSIVTKLRKILFGFVRRRSDWMISGFTKREPGSQPDSEDHLRASETTDVAQLPVRT